MEFKLLPLCLIALFVSSCVTYQFQKPLKQDSRPETYRVAIIGGGAGGSSAAYHLRKFADSSPLDIPIEIDLFESADRIGGRTTTVNAFDDERYPVELGGSIFVEVNKILVNLTNEFGLNTKTNLHEAGPDSDYDLGVWDGSQFVFKQSSGEGRWQGYWDIAKLLWKYGLSPIRTQRLMKDAVGRFLNFYEAPTFPFATLQSAVMKNKLLEFTSQPGSETLASAGISDAFARDIIQASTRVNYAQNLGQIHGLETMCCMATSGAMAVEGGNWQIFDAAVKHSQADVMLNTTIQGVIKDIHNQQYYLARNKQEGAHVRLSDPYDSIILAAPYQFSGIDFEPELARLPESIDYVSLYVTLFTSPHPLSPTFFDMAPEEWKAVPSTVLTTLSADMNSSSPEPHKFFSISTLRTMVESQQHEQATISLQDLLSCTSHWYIYVPAL